MSTGSYRGGILIRSVIVSLLLSTPVVSLAATDTSEFSRDEYRQRFRTLAEELRCSRCQNNNLADSGAPVTADMRRKIPDAERGEAAICDRLFYGCPLR